MNRSIGQQMAGGDSDGTDGGPASFPLSGRAGHESNIRDRHRSQQQHDIAVQHAAEPHRAHVSAAHCDTVSQRILCQSKASPQRLVRQVKC